MAPKLVELQSDRFEGLLQVSEHRFLSFVEKKSR